MGIYKGRNQGKQMTVYEEIKWQPNQNIAIRDKFAIVRCGSHSVTIFREDRVLQFTEGLDDWGSVNSINYGVDSIWKTPDGREFASLKDAISYVKRSF